MLFNSLEFAVFLLVTFCVYWFFFGKYLRLQNAFVLVASYIFYGWWDWRFLALIFISSISDYVLGIKIFNAVKPNNMKVYLFISLTINLGLLFFFKYFNFFIDSFVLLSNKVGLNANINTLKIILPVGISFYTFQTLSYTIDIYRGKIKPTRDIVAFFAFVSFFPQLVAGPIERAANLLPQFLKGRVFSYSLASKGGKLIIWGLFKKVVVADNCAVYVDYVFSDFAGFSSPALLLGAVCFAFQIYGDFSGYSDIAIGTAGLFGFRLLDNFKFPYFSRNIQEFWKRWHISLSSWFRDYVYIPLGGNRNGKIFQTRNSIVTFVVSGLWHGANWTFVAWGFLHGLYYLPAVFKNKVNGSEIVAEGRKLPNPKELTQVLCTFGLVVLAWIFFRANSLGEALQYIARLTSFEFNGKWYQDSLEVCTYAILIMVMVEWIQREKSYVLEFPRIYQGVRWGIYIVLICASIYFYKENQNFIYFQF